MEVSVILPTFNEKKNILLLINQIKKNLKKNKLELIIIDDNSPDKTGLICKKKFAKDKSVKVLVNKKRIGLSESIYEGISYSSKKILLLWILILLMTQY